MALSKESLSIRRSPPRTKEGLGVVEGGAEEGGGEVATTATKEENVPCVGVAYLALFKMSRQGWKAITLEKKAALGGGTARTTGTSSWLGGLDIEKKRLQRAFKRGELRSRTTICYKTIWE